MKKKHVIILSCALLVVVVLALASSYALFTFNVTKNSNFKVAIGNFELSITDTTTEDKYILEDTVPTKDSVALASDGYNFTIKNTGNIDSYYDIYLDDIVLADSGDRLSNSYVKFNLFNNNTNTGNTYYLSDYPSVDRIVTSDYLEAGESVSYTLRMWVDYNVGNEAQNKYFATQIRVVGTQKNAIVYEEKLLNGATPVLTDNLVPVEIDDTGKVTKADLNSKWYSYEDKRWANAVVLRDDNATYENGAVIEEDAIESYFVWIPKYSYQLWDLGNYDSLTTISSKEHTIPIKFGLTNTSDSNTGECTTPSVAGESGSCQVGDYMTHPAFLAFNTNGFWVGKFETGYDGATTTATAQVNSSDSSKIIIKPDVYSWRSATLGNMFKASLEYLENNNSHMMKNTEWGSVAYLQHSAYGSATSVRINNNSSYITGYAAVEEPTLGHNAGASIEGNRVQGTSLGKDGTYTVNYLNSKSVVASTTGNYTGIYDISGGSWEYVMGYTSTSSTTGGSSGITDLYSDFFTNSDYEKYYDKYTSRSVTNYNYRILGDATGEIGPFSIKTDPDGKNRPQSSWHGDYAYFIASSYPWFRRGGNWYYGSSSGSFASDANTGELNVNVGFRVVLFPTETE